MHSFGKCYGVLTLCKVGPRFRDYTSEQHTQVPTSRSFATIPNYDSGERSK